MYSPERKCVSPVRNASISNDDAHKKIKDVNLAAGKVQYEQYKGQNKTNFTNTRAASPSKSKPDTTFQIDALSEVLRQQTLPVADARKKLEHGDSCKVQPANASCIEKFLVDLWRSQQMCDLVLKVGRYELLAHKLALAAHSPQFAQQCIVEAPTGPCEICLLDTTVEATQEVLKYIYTKSISITDINVDPVLSCVRQIGVKGALEECRAHLMSFVKETSLNFMWTARKYQLMDIYSILHDYVCRNFGAISKTEAFLNSSVDNVKKLLEDDNLNIERELDIYFIATTWLDYNRQERMKHTKDILNTVRFALIVPDDIVQYVEPNIMHYSEECGIMLTNVFRYHALRYSGGGLDKNLPVSRKYTPYEMIISQAGDYTQNNSQNAQVALSNQINCFNAELLKPPQSDGDGRFLTFGGIEPYTSDGSQACRMVEEYKSLTNSWHLLTKLPDTRHHHGVATLDGFFYLVGGYTVDEDDSSGPTNSCYRYSYAENFWSRTCYMEHARAYHGVAVLGGVLYAVGGQGVSERDLDSLEFYNPDTDTWAEATSLTECKRGVATIGYQGLLYCIGGFIVVKDKKSVLATVECFDPLQNMWIRKNSISTARCHADVVNINDKLYLIGGATFYEDCDSVSSLDSILRYNETADHWDAFSHMPMPRHDIGCAVIESKLYILGGINSVTNNTLDDVICLDVETGNWITGIKRLTSRSLGIASCTPPVQIR